MTEPIATDARVRRRLPVPDHARDPEPRREQLVSLLAAANAPVPGEQLAHRLGVSRQAIVQDVAVLRAAGHPIVATVRGYLFTREVNRRGYRTVVAVRHAPSEAEDELLGLVDLGIRVLDVAVEHPVYGELRAELHLGAPADVRAWAERTSRSAAHLLSELTDGAHRHTLEADTESLLGRGRAVLAERGFLLNER